MITQSVPGLTIAQHDVDNANNFVTATDVRAQMAHFSLAVRAGHFFDPKEHQGLAHLLEHMLFLGSRQRPGPNQIAQHIQKLGGSVNAWTAGEFANFHFSCVPSAINDAIPAFLEAIFHPLLTLETIQNEIQSIDAEFKFKRKDELRRLYQIHKETSNPDHPFSQFSVGNAELFGRYTLPELRQELRRFHKQFYHKNNVHIALSAPNLNDTHIQLLTHSIEHLPSGDEVLPHWPKLYRDEDLSIKINVKPLQDARRLIITFAILEDIKPLQKAVHFISHILGDESEGSLLAYLRTKGWATNLIAGNGIEGSDFKDFNINIQITEVGEAALGEVLKALFHTLDLLRQSDTHWRRQEKENLDQLARNYSESPLSQDAICDLAESLFFGDLTFSNVPCSESELQQVLSWMRPEYLRLKVISPDVNTDKTSQYYDAEYSTTPISEALLTCCLPPFDISTITLPEPNPYVVNNPVLVARNSNWSVPTDLSTLPSTKIWFSQEHSFNSVKGDLYTSFDSPVLCADAQSNVSKRLWLHCVNTRLQSALYRANIAGMHYRLYGHQCGFSMHCRGFTQALLPLASTALEDIFKTKCNERAFDNAKQTQLRTLTNSLMNKPINGLFSRLSVFVQRYSYAPISLLDALPSLTFEKYADTINQALSQLHSESFLHGNWTIGDAEQWQHQLSSLQNRFTIPTPISRDVVKLPAGESLIQEFVNDHDDAAIVLYLQSPTDTARDTAFCMVLEQLISGPFFNALRTEQQLGYVVGTGYVPHNQHPGIAFYIQSPTHDVNQLFHAMIRFLREQINDLFFYQSYWPSIQQNLLKQLSENDINLAMQSQRHWLNLGIEDPNNLKLQALADAVNNMTFDDVVIGAETVLSRSSFGELILYSKGKFNDLDDNLGRKIINIDKFKAEATFFS